MRKYLSMILAVLMIISNSTAIYAVPLTPGTLGIQNKNNVNITGGTIDNVSIGSVTGSATTFDNSVTISGGESFYLTSPGVFSYRNRNWNGQWQMLSNEYGANVSDGSAIFEFNGGLSIPYHDNQVIFGIRDVDGFQFRIWGPGNAILEGGLIATDGSFTTLSTSSTATHSAGEVIPDDQTVGFGTDSDYLCGFVSSSSVFKCYTNDNGATLTDTDGMFTFQVNAANGTLDPGQRVFQILNYQTSLFYVDDQGNLRVPGEITGVQFNSDCSPTDNTCYLNAADDGPPSSPVLGDHYYNRTINRPGWYDNTAWRYLPTVMTENATFKTPTSGDKAKFRKPYGMTVSSVGCVADAATSVVLDVQECNSSGASCTTILSSTITCTTTYGTGTISDSAIASGNYVFFSLGTVTGTPGYLYVDFNYSVTGE